MAQEENTDWINEIDWTPLTSTRYWASKCFDSAESLSSTLDLLWREVSRVEQQLREWEKITGDEDLHFAIADILAVWAHETNGHRSQTIDVQPAVEFPYLIRRLSGTVPSSMARESALHAIDRLFGMMRLIWLNFVEPFSPPADEQEECEPSRKVSGSAKARQHGYWTKDSPPDGFQFHRQLPRPIEATQAELLKAMVISEKTLRKHAFQGKIHVMLLKKRGKENFLRCWFPDANVHEEILDEVKRARVRSQDKRE